MVTSASHRRGAVRRAELLDGLVVLFLSEGFLAFSVESLAHRLQCSKSTLYDVAPSKEQLITVVVRDFFRRATERVEQSLAAVPEPVGRIGAYLDAISAELAPASRQFFDDLEAFAPAREFYARNTDLAALRVQQLVAESQGEARHLDAAFIGVVAGLVMRGIQRGEVEQLTALDSAASYQALADLIEAGLTGTPVRSDQ